jgi:hypothetical protein
MQIGAPNFNAVDGLNKAYQDVQKSASTIASKEAIEKDISQESELVNMKQSELNFSSIAKVVKAEDNMMGFLLDEKV